MLWRGSNVASSVKRAVELLRQAVTTEYNEMQA